MTKKKLLNNLLADLASITGQATTEDAAKLLGKSHYLQLEYNSIYGGYRLVNGAVQNGSHSGAFGGNGCEGRLSSKLMELKLRSLIYGVEYSKR